MADPVACLGELRDWVRSMMETEGFRAEHRVDVLRQLDDAAQPHLRRLARDYAANARMPKHQEQRLWGALSGTSAEFGAAWARCIEQAAADGGVDGKFKAELPLTLMRGLRTLGTQLKWRYMHYEQADAAVWKAVGQMARFADEKKLLAAAVPPGGATPGRELARILMLAASSPDSLLPADIDLAERVVAHFDAAIAITNTPQPQVSRCCIDLDAGTPPWRMAERGGVIRRRWRPRADQMNIGVRTHAKETFPVKVAKMGTDRALLMNDGRALGAEALLCVPEGSYSQQVSPVMEFDGRQYLLIPIERVDAGDDFELGRYRVMQQG